MEALRRQERGKEMCSPAVIACSCGDGSACTVVRFVIAHSWSFCLSHQTLLYYYRRWMSWLVVGARSAIVVVGVVSMMQMHTAVAFLASGAFEKDRSVGLQRRRNCKSGAARCFKRARPIHTYFRPQTFPLLLIMVGLIKHCTKPRRIGGGGPDKAVPRCL
jgi:hypothetical protein